jgi:sec-independent protein translocase protein TatC
MSFGGNNDSEDFFSDTRMSFGEHIEDLRKHLIRALVGFMIIIHGVFVCDAIGYFSTSGFGVGRPMMTFIRSPVERALQSFYDRRSKQVMDDLKGDHPTASLVEADKAADVPLWVDLHDLAEKLHLPPPGPEPASPEDRFVRINARANPVSFAAAMSKGSRYIGRRPTELSTLSVTEAMLVYIKVSLLCGVVLSSPWIFYQLWSFVAAGLYPSEKKTVNYYLPLSLGLFLFGVLICEFLVIPSAVEALLWFNEWLDLEPELRLNEWLGFAVMLPLVFGLSFQTPLVMLFLSKIGIFGLNSFRTFRKYAYLILGVFAAIVNPSSDIPSWTILWVSLCLLYELGILLTRFTQKAAGPDVDVPESEEMVEV